MQLVDVYRARIVDVAPDSLMVEVTGTEDKIDSLLDVLRPYGVHRGGAHGPRGHGARRGAHAAGAARGGGPARPDAAHPARYRPCRTA